MASWETQKKQVSFNAAMLGALFEQYWTKQNMHAIRQHRL